MTTINTQDLTGPPLTMPVHTSTGQEQRQFTVRADADPVQRMQPNLRQGEIAVRTIGGECIVIDTGHN